MQIMAKMMVDKAKLRVERYGEKLWVSFCRFSATLKVRSHSGRQRSRRVVRKRASTLVNTELCSKISADLLPRHEPAFVLCVDGRRVTSVIEISWLQIDRRRRQLSERFFIYVLELLIAILLELGRRFKYFLFILS